jgi:hypothetical protein
MSPQFWLIFTDDINQNCKYNVLFVSFVRNRKCDGNTKLKSPDPIILESNCRLRSIAQNFTTFLLSVLFKSPPIWISVTPNLPIYIPGNPQHTPKVSNLQLPIYIPDNPHISTNFPLFLDLYSPPFNYHVSPWPNRLKLIKIRQTRHFEWRHRRGTLWLMTPS